MLWLMLGLAVALVAVHMARPKYRNRKISSALFFRHLPPPRLAGGRLRWGRPRLSRAFLLQALVLLLVAAALFAHLLQWRIHHKDRIGLWVLVDTSAGMSLSDNRAMKRVNEALAEVLTEMTQQFPGAATIYKLSTFDLERRDLLETESGDALALAVKNLEPRSLGTDLGLVREIVTADGLPENLSHLMVFSDMPAPDFASDPRVIWLCVGEETANAGLAGVSVVEDVFSGGVSSVSVGLRAYGPAPAASAFMVTGPDQTPVLHSDPIPWQGDLKGAGSSWSLHVPITQAGTYRFEMTPTDAYPLDNQVLLDLDPSQKLKVDWQVPDHRIFGLLNWQQTQADPALVITDQLLMTAATPTIILAPMANRGGETPILSFVEDHPLLQDLNLDAVEQLGLNGVVLPPGFDAILSLEDGRVLVGEAKAQKRVLIPAFLQPTDAQAEPVLITLFFNGVRRLLERQEKAGNVSLTTPFNPEPGVNRLAIHPDEGNFWRKPVSVGSVATLAQTGHMTRSYPLWAMFLALSAVVLVLERTLNLLFPDR